MIADGPIVLGDGASSTGGVFAAFDRDGYLGLRREGSKTTIYIPLGQLEYMVDEARRAQHPQPRLSRVEAGRLGGLATQRARRRGARPSTRPEGA